MDDLKKILNQTKDNIIISDAFTKAVSVLNKNKDKTIICSVSGGSDSDIMMDIIEKVKGDIDVKYIWFDTGLEYKATKEHIKYLENKYNATIERVRAIKPIPTCCKEYGQPFLSKYVSEQIDRLQRHNFKWEDKTYEELQREYPLCKSAVKWWCNQYTKENDFDNVSRFDIGYNKYLKEFLIKNPPSFKISNQCCNWAKKKVSHKIEKEYKKVLHIIGIRQAEGGIRSTMYKNCYSDNGDKSNYRPIFWFKNSDKEEYEYKFKIKHSDCYSKYGFKRTGCCCCPYGKELEQELDAIRKYEPNLYKAVNNIFGKSYEYTKQYRKFCERKKQEEKLNGQMTIFDYMEK